MVLKVKEGQPTISCPTCGEVNTIIGLKAPNCPGQPCSPDAAPKATAIKADDVLSKLEDSVMCLICMDTYSDPKVLQCHHTFFRECLVRLMGRRQPGQPVVSCPICRQDTPVPTDGVAGLQPAFHINHLQVMLKQIKPDIVEMGARSESGGHDPKLCRAPRGTIEALL